MFSSTFGTGWVGMSACPLVVFARAYMYTLCVFGAVNTQGFVWEFFFLMRYIYIFIHSFIILFLIPLGDLFIYWSGGLLGWAGYS